MRNEETLYGDERLFVRPMPITPYKRALNAVKQAHEDYLSLDGRRAKIEKYRYSDALAKLRAEEGEKGIQKLDLERQDITATENALSERAVAVVMECIEQYQNELESMFGFKPEHLQGDNSAVVAMLNSGIIQDEQELIKLIKANRENNTICRMCVAYAQKNGWSRIPATNLTEERLRSASQIFDQILDGARNLGGYMAMLVAYPTTEVDFVKTYGIEREYLLALGQQ